MASPKRCPLGAAGLLAVVPEIVSDDVIGGALRIFERRVQQAEVFRTGPALHPNEKLTVNRRRDDRERHARRRAVRAHPLYESVGHVLVYLSSQRAAIQTRSHARHAHHVRRRVV
jgi:ribosomal protein S21